MLTTIDHLISLLSSTAIGTSVVVLSIIHIPQKVRWEPISRARWILVATFTILAISGLFKIEDSEPNLLSTITLCVASYQALLFSYTASIMLTRREYTHQTVVALIVITLATILLFFTKFALPSVHIYVWYLAAAAYLAQIVFHTIAFRRQIRETAAELEHYYDENVDYHLRPIQKFFYSALAIGILAGIASLSDIQNWGYNTFVIIYTIYYIYVTVAIMNYCIDGDFFLVPAEDLSANASVEYEVPFAADITSKASYNAGDTVEDNGVDKPLDAETEEEKEKKPFYDLEQALNAWVARREFIKVDVSTDQVAELLCVTRQELVDYFKVVHNTTFRSWRQQLRVEYARCLIHDYPNISLARIHEQVGFNDRSNFHTAFRKFTGTTPQEYRDSLL